MDENNSAEYKVLHEHLYKPNISN